MEINYADIGARIKRYRTALGMTQAQLSEKSGMEPSNISHIERGATKLSLQALIAIANALDVSADALLCDSLERSEEQHRTDITELLSDCSAYERKVLIDSMRGIKDSIRKAK